MNKTINKIKISILVLAFALGSASTSFAMTPVSLPVASLPTMVTSSASNITATSATLNGFYNDGGSPMTQIYFDYGSSPALGTLSGFGTITGSSGNYNVNISGLTSGTTYYVKAVGANGTGMSWSTIMISFTTKTVNAPVVSTNSASNIASTSATLNGYFNSANSSAQTYFEYGTSVNSLTSTTSPVSQANSFGNFNASVANLTPNTTYYYRAVATNSVGTTHSPMAISFKTSGGVTPTCAINSFSASQTTVTPGTPVTLSWNTSNCVTGSISGYGAILSVSSGSGTVYPTSSTTYILTAYDANGASVTMSVFINVSNNNTNSCNITSFQASSPYIPSGSPVTISWNTINCNTVIVSGAGLNSNALVGSQVVYPTYSSTYTITAYGSNGIPMTQSVSVTVGNNNTNNCFINNFSASTLNTTANSPVTLTWNTNGCTNVSLSNIGNVNTSGSQVVYPSVSTNYVLTAYSSTGTPITQTIYITVNQIISNTNVVTITATNITKSTAQVNGLITNTNANISGVYFEYGTTVNLGYKTALHGTNGNSNFSDTLVNLSQDTIYYYRAVADTSTGTYRGAIEIFATLKNGTNPIIIGPTIIGTNSPIMLKIEDRYEYIGVGDTLDYTVYYKNISNKKLTHPMLQVIVPKNITLTNSSAGTYSTDTNTLSVPLNDLMPKDEGTIFVQGHVDSLSSNTAQIVTTAILVYTSNNGAQENAMAYVLNRPKDGGLGLGANAFGSGFLPSTFIGWLLLTVFILLVIMLARMFMDPKPHAQAYVAHH